MYQPKCINCKERTVSIGDTYCIECDVPSKPLLRISRQIIHAEAVAAAERIIRDHKRRNV